jgi:hypothetical protein
MNTIIRNNKFTKLPKSVKPDAKKRIVLPKELVGEDITFRIYTNSDGQILLDPQVTISASELWVFQNPEILASLNKGMAEAKSGKVTKHGSFVKYIND